MRFQPTASLAALASRRLKRVPLCRRYQHTESENGSSMNRETKPINFCIDLDDHERIGAGWLICRVTMDSTEVQLWASDVSPFSPFNDLVTFLENLITNRLPCHFYWDGEGNGIRFEAMPTEWSSVFRFTLTEIEGVSSVIYDVDAMLEEGVNLRSSIMLTGVCDKRQFVSAFLKELERLCRETDILYEDTTTTVQVTLADMWSFDCERLEALKHTLAQQEAA